MPTKAGPKRFSRPHQSLANRAVKLALEKYIAKIAQLLIYGNRLKLNTDKIDFITFGTHPQLEKLNFDNLDLCDTAIRESPFLNQTYISTDNSK